MENVAVNKEVRKTTNWYDSVKASAVIKSAKQYASFIISRFYKKGLINKKFANSLRFSYTREIDSCASAIRQSYLFAGGRVEPLLNVLAKSINESISHRAKELNLNDYLLVFNDSIKRLKIDLGSSAEEYLNLTLKDREFKDFNKDIVQGVLEQPSQSQQYVEPQQLVQEPLVLSEEQKLNAKDTMSQLEALKAEAQAVKTELASEVESAKLQDELSQDVKPEVSEPAVEQPQIAEPQMPKVEVEANSVPGINEVEKIKSLTEDK